MVRSQNGSRNGQTGACQVFEESSIQSTTDEQEENHSKADDDNFDDDDDVYQEFEEFDFSQLSDCKSIASDDSFYPPDESIPCQRSPTPESPEPLTLFKACCNNNSIIVKIFIRQGVTEEEVREVDKNNRVSFYGKIQQVCLVPRLNRECP